MSTEGLVAIGGAVLAVLTNAGALVYLGRRALDRIDQHSMAIGPMVKTLETLAEGQRELFIRSDSHEKRLTETEVVRRLNGCEDPIIRVGKTPGRA